MVSRFAAAAACPRAMAMLLLAALSHMLIKGFFLIQGFFKACSGGLSEMVARFCAYVCMPCDRSRVVLVLRPRLLRRRHPPVVFAQALGSRRKDSTKQADQS